MTCKPFKDATHKNKAFGAFITYLSRAWDCLDHDLLIAKLYVYSLNMFLKFTSGLFIKA